MSLVKVKYNAPSIYTLGNHKLIPGINLIESDLWSSLEGHCTVKERIKSGIIKVYKSKSGAVLTTEDISELYDVFKLDHLAKGDDLELARAAQEQLDKINGMAKKATEE